MRTERSKTAAKPPAPLSYQMPPSLPHPANENFTTAQTPVASDAGALSQKSLPPAGMQSLPKLAEKDTPMAYTRPVLQTLVKEAMKASSTQAVRSEAARQTKQASASKVNENPRSVPTDYAEKLAEAMQWTAQEFRKQASGVGPGQGPNALPVSGAMDSGQMPGPNSQGHAAHQPDPTSMQKADSGPGAATQLKNTQGARPGGTGSQEVALSGGAGKTASVRNALLGRQGVDLKTKVAQALSKKASDEEAAGEGGNISGGKGNKTAPETSASGQPGGAPLGGGYGPKGSLVGSNEAAINYTKGQSHGPRREELKSYWSEPALSAARDTTLTQAFAHTGQAGTKLASADDQAQNTARALLEKIAAEADKTRVSRAGEHG